MASRAILPSKKNLSEKEAHMTDVPENDAATDLTTFARALEELAARRAVGKQLEAWAVWLERAGTGSVNDRIAQQLRADERIGVLADVTAPGVDRRRAAVRPWRRIKK